MSTEAVVVLHVSAAKARKRIDPTRVLRLGEDACGVRLFERHEGLEIAPARAAEMLRALIGELLEDHDDPRGVLLYPDAAEPKPAKYAALVRALESSGFWIDRTLLGRSAEELQRLDAEQEAAGGFIERIGGLVERQGKSRKAPIVAVDLHQTKPTADDFARLFKIATLRSLDLRHVTTLTRSALLQLGKHRNLERLVLDELKITDEDLSAFRDMPSLQALSVVKTRIQGDGFSELVRLPSFKEITIGFTPLDDAGLHIIAKLPHLEVLRLAPSNVTDAGVARVAEHPKLRVLDASRTRITDAVVPALLAAPALQSVRLRATALSARAIATLRTRAGLAVET